MNQRIESFLADVLALAGEDMAAVREGVRVALASCEALFRVRESNNRRTLEARAERFAVTCRTTFLPVRDLPHTWEKPRKVNEVPSVSGRSVPFGRLLRKSTNRVLSGWSVSPYRARRLPKTPRTRLASRNTARHTGRRTFLLRPFGDHGFRGDQEPGDRRCILQRCPHNLGWVDDALGDEIDVFAVHGMGGMGGMDY
jgi:hypothetical protein